MPVLSRQIRGRLLKALEAASPLRLSLAQLYEVTVDAQLNATAKAVKAECAYLVDKGYAEAFGADRWAVTAAGRDILEGTTEDPGIILEETE